MFGKHRLQKPTRFVGLPTKWKVSPKTDEIMGNSGTATAVPAVPRAAPLPIKIRKGETSSGYFLDEIQPHRIPLPSDSSGESKDYDPDIYPKGTPLDIREDEGDGKHVKSFVSLSDDEGTQFYKKGGLNINLGDV